MKYTSADEKELIRQNVHKFVNDGQKLNLQSYIRLMSWLDGQTYAEIAKEEGVSDSAVAFSVKRSVEAIKIWLTI